MVVGAIRVASTSLSALLAYLYVGGHVQNDTLAAEYGFATIDARTGSACAHCDDECVWWEASAGNDTPVDCVGSNLRRALGSDVIARALDRASRCASRSGEACVLSHEVGFPLPAAFVWNASEHGLQPILLPRLRRIEGARAIRISHVTPELAMAPGGRESMLTFDQHIGVEHYDLRSRGLVQAELHDEAAYCLQLLQRSVPDACMELLPPTEAPPDERV